GLALQWLGPMRWRDLRIRLLARRESQCEPSAFIPAGAFCGNRPVVCLDKRFANRKTKTQTPQLRATALFKSVENFGQGRGFDPQASIDNFNMQLTPGTFARGDGD